ncbi:hypothetical protein LY71_1085 [Geodermatophilus tzadiensis]|uniref:site-specific DNA-methyltransferase (adenine-specific) n=1 Tax=Geodermatophilus tzadiensis TaxID=1137988 RepID=A0A2T0TSJ4_9ACTN|nr:hypothetical protein [Geodermatophilus tzadiensis]PRY48627.1 hypothetical protein LY71_1085 [Geodermatophilus tzadiensis]
MTSSPLSVSAGAAPKAQDLRRLATALSGLAPLREAPAAAALLVAEEAADAGRFAAEFPTAAARVAVLRRALETTDNGVAALALISRMAPHVLPEELGQLYQALRRPHVRRANAVAFTGGAKLDGADLLAVTQFLTDGYLVRWLTARTLDGLDDASLVVADPAVGGGAFLLAAYRHLIASPTWAVPAAERSAVLLDRVLRGYDLDPALAEIAAVALWLQALRHTGDARAPNWITTGGHPLAGALDPVTLGRVLPAGEQRRLALLTNPPFLGRRLMGVPLRQHLKAHFPSAGNDLCAAFVGHLTTNLTEGDRLGVVHQSTLTHLVTLAQLRRSVIARARVLDAVDLGSGAFRELSGDKARVTLTLLEGGGGAGDAWPEARLDLSALNREAKQAALEADLAGTPSSGHRARAASLRALRDAHPAYSTVARPMQGSSTGDNTRFVRFAWEVPADEEGWREASKGGGYSKWWGLRRYVVRWGEGGSLLRAHSGAALRNPELADAAQLVWSDTGTAGLNVRLHAPGSVFMASGPGILVGRGEPLSHAAVLNSRVLTAYLRCVNPKLTLTAGALAASPFPEAALGDETLRALAAQCVRLKQRAESRRPDCLDWVGAPAVDGDLLDVLGTIWLADLDGELQRLAAEAEIDDRVAELFGDADGLTEERVETTGVAAARQPEVPLLERPDHLEARFARRLTPGLRYSGGLRTPTGCEGPLEALSLYLGASAASVAHRLREATLPVHTLRKYLEAVLHEHCLAVMGFTADRTWRPRRRPLPSVAGAVAEAVGTARMPLLDQPVEEWIARRLGPVHTAAFRRRPVLHVGTDEIRLAR